MPRDEEETTTAKPKPKYATNPFENTRGANASANRPRPTANSQQQDYSEGQTNQPTPQREQTVEQKLGQQPRREAPYKYVTDDATGLTRKIKLPGALSGTYRAPSVTMDKVQRGEANWTDVFTAERERILKDPNFYKTNQITQYSPFIQQQIIADKAFDWTQVPKWQKPFYEASSRPAVAGAVQGLIMGAGNPGGAAVGAVIGAAAQATGYDQTKEAWQQGDNKFTWDANQLKEAGKGAFGYLNLLAEWGEKVIGTSAMAVNAAADPNKNVSDVLNKDTFNANASFFEVIAPAIKAAEQGDGRITWSDAQKLIPALWQGGVVADLVLHPEKYKGEEYYLGASMPVELQQTWTERIDAARAEIASGRDYREVMTEMQTGIMAQIGDMAGQGFFDPLNVMPKVETGIIRKGAELSGNKPLAEAFTGVETPREGMQKYQNIIQTGEAAKIDPNFDAQKLNGFEKYVAGLNKEGEVKAGGLTSKGLLDPADPKKPRGGLFEETPQSRAQTGATMFDRNIGTLMTMFKDPTEAVGYIRRIAGGDMNAWKEMGSSIGNSPEWYTILPALKDFSADKLEGLAKAWEVTAINRDALGRIADVLGDNPTKLIDDWAARNNTDQDFARIIQRAKDANTPESNALLKEFEAGTFTPDTLKQIVDLFHGEGALPHTEAQWKWAMYADMSDHFAEWVAKHLLLDKSPEATSTFFQTMAVLKQAQSIILLGASPGYAIQNGLSGIVHLATDGIYGSMTPRQMDDWITRWETPIPRLDEGVGIGGMVDTARSSAISDAVKPGKGPLTDLKQTLSRIQRGMPMSALSSKFESVNSKRGYVTGIKKFWANSWRRGKGFRKMDGALAKVLTDAGIDPNRIYAAIEAGANQKEIERALTGQYKGMQAKALINDAAQSAGITPEQAADMLDKIGLTETLDTFLAGADTPDKVDAAFTRANKKMQDWIDLKYGERLATRAEEVKNIVGREGMAAGLNVAQQASNQFYDAWFDHYARFGDVMGGLEGLEPAQRSKVIEEAYRQSDTNFRRVFASMGANYQGIFEVWGLSGDPDATSAVHAISDMNNSMKQAYDFMRQKRNEFSATLNREDRAPTGAELRSLNTGIDKAFEKAFKAKHAAEIRMGEALKGVYTKLHGANAGNAAKLWWNDVMKFSEKIVADEKKFRAEQDTAREMGADRASLSDAKKKYYSENKQRWIADLQKINDEGIARLERIIKNKGGDATPTPAPTEPTPPSDAGPATTTPTAEPTAPRDTPPAKKPTKAQERAAAQQEEINKLLADVEKIDAAEKAERTNQVSSVWDIAEGYWNRGGNFTRNSTDKYALLPILKKPEYGGISDLMGLYDPRLDSETVTRILDTRKAIKDAEAATATPPSIREIKKRKVKDSANVNILDAIRSYGGLNIAKITDYAKDKKVGSMFGVFQKQAYSKGWDITDMAIRLAEDNYAIDLTDGGGVKQLTDLLQEALSIDPETGELKNIYPTTHDYTADTAKINAAELAHIEALKADEAAFTVEQFNAETWKARMQEAIAKKDGEAVDTLFGELPDELSNTAHDADGETYAEYILRAQNNIEADAVNDARATAIATAKTQADAAVKDSETRAEAVTTRTLMLESWTEIFGAEQAQTYMEMSDAIATWYERTTGNSADEFYSRYYEEARKSVEADVIGDLEQSYRVGENVQNRSISQADAQNYARMLARSESEARSAIRNEPNKADRIAILKALHDINPDMAENVARAAKADMLLQTVFHGSPYKFDKFSLDHLGTGEGAQAYGWGLYFAGSKNVAEFYRENLAPRKLSDIENNLLKAWDSVDNTKRMMDGAKGNIDRGGTYVKYNESGAAIAVSTEMKDGYTFRPYNRGEKAAVTKSYNEAKTIYEDRLRKAEGLGQRPEKPGQLYAVDIPDDNYLLWDKPLSEQPQSVKDAVNKLTEGAYWENPKGDGNMTLRRKDGGVILWRSPREVNGRTPAQFLNGMTGETIYKTVIGGDTPKNSSLALKEAGINGIQYLDGSSRDASRFEVVLSDKNGEYARSQFKTQEQANNYAAEKQADGYTTAINELGNYNYVIFDDSAVKVLETFYQAEGMGANKYPDLGKPGYDYEHNVDSSGEKGMFNLNADRNVREYWISKGMPVEYARNAKYNALTRLIENLAPTVTMRGQIEWNAVAKDTLRWLDRPEHKQPAPIGAKGAVVFGADGIKATIHAFEAADFSTLVHENAHVFRRVMKDVAERTGNKQVVKDLATIEEWAGVKDGNWTVPAEEKFARGFEKYIATGEAPTPRLKAAFETFKGWMMQVYRTITGSAIDVKITDEVKGVFDRMLGAEGTTSERKINLFQLSEGDDAIAFLQDKIDSANKMNEKYPGITEQRWLDKLSGAIDTYKAYIKQYGKGYPIVLIKDQPEVAGRPWYGAVIAPSSKYAGEWQTTHFDERGFSGDSQSKTQAEAFWDTYSQGLTRPDPDLLDTVSDTDLFNAGVKWSQLPDDQRFTTSINEVMQKMKSDPLFQRNKAQVSATQFDMFAPQAEATTDTGTTGGLLPGMQEATGMMFDVQQGGGITKMDAGNARTIYDIDPTKTAGEFRAGDIVQDADGKQHTVSGANMRSKIVTDKGRILDPQDVTRVAKQETLFQRADPFKEADLPIGSIEEAGQQPPHHEAMHEGYLENIAPLMKAMQQVAREQVGNKPLDGAMRDLSPEGAAMLKKYRNQVNADMAGTKNAATKWGEQSRDFAMLNYNKRYGIDRYIETIYPYQFFYTRSLATWAARAIDKPAIFSQYARIKKQQDRYERDIPERLRGKIKISLPWLPDWMGDALYIDPMRTLFTPLNYARPFERMIQDNSYQQIEAERILQEWASDGTVAEKDIVDAIKNREGATWERAFAEAQIRRESEITNPMDFMNTMLGPAWYLTTPYKLLKGEQAGIGSTPILNTTRALDTVTQGTWAQPIGDLIGMIGKPEEMLRQKLNIPEFGEYGDYYVDRQLANMVADGLISSDEAQQAMIERTGANFDTARERVKMELAMRVPTASALLSGLTAENFVQGVTRMAMTAPVSLFGAGILPSGELEYRGLKGEWNEAWKRKDAGDDKAITAFFDDHPEYEAYLSKGKEPEERLRGYLVGQIWDGYMGLGTTDRKQATAEMGDEFQRDFLSTETRSYEGIDIEQLAQWAQMLNKNVPNTASTAPAIAAPKPQIDYYDPEITKITDKFFNDRTRMFPDYYVKQNAYYNIPESDKSGRYKYLAQNPELKQYWDWKKAYEKKYPELVPIIKGQVFKQIDTSAWPPALLDYVTIYAYTGQKLPKGAYKALEQVWLSEGKPLGSVDAWLSSDVAPALLYSGGGQ